MKKSKLNEWESVAGFFFSIFTLLAVVGGPPPGSQINHTHTEDVTYKCLALALFLASFS